MSFSCFKIFFYSILCRTSGAIPFRHVLAKSPATLGFFVLHAQEKRLSWSMNRLVINFKSKKDYELVKAIASRLDADIENLTPQELKKNLPKSKFKSEAEFFSYAGSMKGQLISKEHLRSVKWKKRS